MSKRRRHSKPVIFNRKKFDDIRQESDGIEYWYARELMKLLDYVQWRNFDNAVNKAMLSCENNGDLIGNHFSKQYYCGWKWSTS